MWVIKGIGLIMEGRLRVFTAFSGYDSQCMALDRLGMDYDLVGWSEIDRYAIRAHDAIYPRWSDRNYGDITRVDWDNVPDFDLFTMSSPCQDFSSAGLQRGGDEGSGTRSSLLWECRRAILAKKPKFILFENVKALVSKKFLPYFLKWGDELSSYGYTNFTRVLNAKDYGVPQNRERVFMVSILGDGWYEFPAPFALGKRLKDVLEKDVDESYYLSDKLIDYVFSNGGKAGDIKGAVGVQDGGKEAVCVTANYWKTPRQGNYVSCAMRGRNLENPSDRTSGIPTEQRIEVWNDVANCLTTVQKDSMVIEPKFIGYTRDKSGMVVKRHLMDVSNTIHTSTGCGGNTDCFVFEPSILTPKRTDYGKAVRKDYESGDLKASRHDMTSLEPREDGISNTITTVQKDNILVEPNDHLNDDCREIIGVSVHPYGHKLEFRGEKSIMPVSPTLRSTDYKCPCTAWENNGEAGCRIRKLTPRECFRLMGVSESDIDKIQAAGISKTQQYKMAGNSIVVDVLYYIFRSLFVEKRRKTGQLSLF